MEEENKPASLPENAYRKLAPGEQYEPLLKKGDKIIFTAFGAGFTWGASYMIWGYDGSKFADTPAEFYKEGMISREEWYAKRRKAQQ